MTGGYTGDTKFNQIRVFKVENLLVIGYSNDQSITQSDDSSLSVPFMLLIDNRGSIQWSVKVEQAQNQQFEEMRISLDQTSAIAISYQLGFNLYEFDMSYDQLQISWHAQGDGMDLLSDRNIDVQYCKSTQNDGKNLILKIKDDLDSQTLYIGSFVNQMLTYNQQVSKMAVCNNATHAHIYMTMKEFFPDSKQVESFVQFIEGIDNANISVIQSRTMRAPNFNVSTQDHFIIKDMTKDKKFENQVAFITANQLKYRGSGQLERTTQTELIQEYGAIALDFTNELILLEINTQDSSFYFKNMNEIGKTLTDMDDLALDASDLKYYNLNADQIIEDYCPTGEII
ncbi:UNKNOWN [Stylonychia lemnae]|uniref:Uncharacterized protein n=1 Tax=Stylonychia lemnae TaxID=5949 RepID=A0A078B6T4_STYLE|nr:UNKNOWN [Stylonychia lemnae]|eukprot:CDW89002.1 UNKNOWN [Stylonychia lemnae]